MKIKIRLITLNFLKIFSKTYIKAFLNNNLLNDEESKKEFSENLEKIINIELNRFNKEINKIIEEKFEKELNALDNKFESFK
jgi:hypothetical protein